MKVESPEHKRKNKKVGWLCTYTPEEVIYAAGFEPYRILPRAEYGGSVEESLPPNICPYVRKVLAELKKGVHPEMEGVVITHSCNAMMHLYDALREEANFFVYLLEVPRRTDHAAVEYYSSELDQLAEFLGSKGQEVTPARLQEAVNAYRERNHSIKRLLEVTPKHFSDYFTGICGLAEEAATTLPGEFVQQVSPLVEKKETSYGKNQKELPSLVLTGGLPPRGMVELLEGQPEFVLYPDNCAGLRYLEKEIHLPEDCGGSGERLEFLRQLSEAYLQKAPCPRIFDYTLREEYFNRLLEEREVKGVVYHDLLFCDLGHYDYLIIKEILEARGIPLLKVETELGQEDLGQLKTRLEAFMEIVV